MMLAAAFSGSLIANNIGIEFNYLVVALIVAAGSIWAGLVFPAHERKTVSASEKAETSKLARKVWTEKRTLLIALIGFSFIMAEISAGTWLPIALTNSGFSGAEAAAAFGWFWVAITVTRAFGGFVVDKLGRFQSIMLSAILTAAGISVFVFDSIFQMPYLGIALWGMGLALGFPMSVNSMSDDPTRSAPRINMIISSKFLLK